MALKKGVKVYGGQTEIVGEISDLFQIRAHVSAPTFA